jgi:SAM-dependent methyltransferase
MRLHSARRGPRTQGIGVSSPVSRRSLFGRGLSRLVPDSVASDLAASRDALRGLAGEPREGVGRSEYEDRVRRSFAADEDGGFARLLEPAVCSIVEVCSPLDGAILLDLGCGEGSLGLQAGRRGAAVSACDPMDVEALPFPDASFDRVASAFGTVFAPRPRVALSEMFRVARSGGTIALATWSPTGFVGEVLNLGCRHAPPPRGVERPSRWGRYETLYRHLGGLARGFDCRALVLAMSFDSEAAMWRALAAPPGPLCPTVAALDRERRARLRTELRELARGYGCEEGGTIEADYVLTVATAG